MRASLLVAALAAACSVGADTFRPRPRNYDTHDYYAIHLDPAVSPEELASHLGLEHDGELGVLPDHHIFKAPKHEGDIVDVAVEELKRRRRRKRDLEPHLLDSIRLNQKQVARKRLVKRSVIPPLGPRDDNSVSNAITAKSELAKSLNIVDPIFNEQWHIFNTQQVGHDLNVTGVWSEGITGKNATVCIIDDGLDMDSLDLAPNYFAKGSYDFNEGVDEPRPRLSDDQHGTRCAGEVAAAKNDVCGVGVAYDSRISGIRILSKPISDIDEAQSVVYGYQENDIYSCSWGPPDDGKTMEAPGILIKRAMVKAVQEGRGGKGTIYVFAAGNGAAADDNCNFDGYTNSIYSITVGAIDKNNEHPYYSEKCSAQLVVTYSSGAGDAIHTTDVGRTKCTGSHGGTSAAGPLGAGVYALVLSARPDLNWRDLQWLTVMTAVPFEADPNDWETTSLGQKFSHQFGYGMLDAYKIVEAAKSWKSVKPQAWLFSPWIHVKHEIPQGDQGLTSTITITKDMLKDANLERLEHVTVTMNIQHSRRGDLSVELRSPTGMVSHLSTARRNDDAPKGYIDWTFMSVAHWGESGDGDWTVVVKDTVVNPLRGRFIDWKLNLFGESIDGSKQALLPLPNEHDDDNHDATIISAMVSTTSVSVPTATEPGTTFTGLPTRPAISKTTAEAAPSVPASAVIPAETTAFDTPVVASPVEGGSAPTATAEPEKEESNNKETSFLPSPFPTFGVSKRTQVWIYGSLGLIIVFCSGLGTYLYLQRRKRLRNNPREGYEFAVLDEVDDDEENGAAAGEMKQRGAGKKGRPKRRAGELYDAFAGESEDELFSGSEDEGYRYRDEDREKHAIGGDSEDEESASGR